MVTCDQQEKVASTPKVLLGNFLQTVDKWVGRNSHSMRSLAGTGPGLYKQLIVRQGQPR